MLRSATSTALDISSTCVSCVCCVCALWPLRRASGSTLHQYLPLDAAAFLFDVVHQVGCLCCIFAHTLPCCKDRLHLVQLCGGSILKKVKHVVVASVYPPRHYRTY